MVGWECECEWGVWVGVRQPQRGEAPKAERRALDEPVIIAAIIAADRGQKEAWESWWLGGLGVG